MTAPCLHGASEVAAMSRPSALLPGRARRVGLWLAFAMAMTLPAMLLTGCDIAWPWMSKPAQPGIVLPDPLDAPAFDLSLQSG